MESNDIYSIDDNKIIELFDYCKSSNIILPGQALELPDFYSRFSKEFWDLHSYINYVYYALSSYLGEHMLGNPDADISIDDFCETNLQQTDAIFDYRHIFFGIYSGVFDKGLQESIVKFIADYMKDKRLKDITNDFYSKAYIDIQIKRPYSEFTTDCGSFWNYKKEITHKAFGNDLKFPYLFFPEVSALTVDLMLDSKNKLYFMIPWSRNQCVNIVYYELLYGSLSSFDISTVSSNDEIGALAGFIELKMKQWVENQHRYIFVRTYIADINFPSHSIIDKAMRLISIDRIIVYARITKPIKVTNADF